MAKETYPTNLTPALSAGAQSLQSAYQSRTDESAGKINTMYDNALASQKSGLKAAYDQNLSDQMAARDNIAGTYRAANNDLSVQYERNRRNLNEQAATSGINTGTGSQQRLALNQQYLTNFGNLRAEQAGAYTEADRQITNLKNQYQNDIAAAIADNDYKRAAALLDDYNNQNTWRDQQAQIMASYGNFSGYADLYGADQAEAMRQIWAMQNPDIAWATGQISKAEYKKLTGKNPHGTTTGSGGYWGDWMLGSSNGTGSNNKTSSSSGSSGKNRIFIRT